MGRLGPFLLLFIQGSFTLRSSASLLIITVPGSLPVTPELWKHDGGTPWSAQRREMLAAVCLEN